MTSSTHKNPNHQAAKAEAMLMLVVLIWGSNYPMTKFGVSGLNQLVFNSIRYIVATIVLLGLFAIRNNRLKIDRADWGKMLWMGFVGSVVYQLLFVYAISRTSAGNVAVLVSTFPLWTVFLSARIHHEKIPPMLWLGLFVSFAGVLMIVAGSGKKLSLGSDELFGDAASLVGAAVWGYSMILQQPLIARYGAHQVTFGTVATGMAGLTLAAVPPAFTLHWTEVGWIYIIIAIISGVLSVAVANILWSYGIRHIGAGKTANFNNLVPVVALLVAFFALHENLYAIELVGAAVTILGVWIARRAGARL
jgi:drug/metabolite transporter (DMT)-like permease